MRVSGEQTGGAFALADHLARRGNASPVHVHDRDDETFFVLDGELRVILGEEEYAAAGTVAVLPRRLRHAYVVTSATARFLTLHSPAGVEQFAAEAGEPAEALTLPPPPAGPPDFAALAQAAARHQITTWPRRPRLRTAMTSLLPSRATPNSGAPSTAAPRSPGDLRPPPGSPGRSSRAGCPQPPAGVGNAAVVAGRRAQRCRRSASCRRSPGMRSATMWSSMRWTRW